MYTEFSHSDLHSDSHSESHSESRSYSYAYTYSPLSSTIPITKSHGLGNDFIIIDNLDKSIDNPWALARLLCNRRTSVGADGVILVERSNVADVRMRIINSDGSEAQMCGNGIRCFARYVYEREIVKSPSMQVETLAGIMTPQLLFNDDSVMAVRVNMGKANFSCKSIPMYCGKERFINGRIEACGHSFDATAVLIGVPHLVVMVKEEISQGDLARFGPALETHGAFPEGVNVDFVRIEDGKLIVSTWERGCGVTLACGTGACATAVACKEAGFLSKLGLGNDAAIVKLRLGELIIEQDDSGDVFMTGDAQETFNGFACI